MIQRCENITLPEPNGYLIERLNSQEYYMQYRFGRSDIAVVSFGGIANVFLFADDTVQIDLYEGITADKEGLKEIETVALKKFEEFVTDDYVNDHRRFFNKMRKLNPDLCIRG